MLIYGGFMRTRLITAKELNAVWDEHRLVSTNFLKRCREEIAGWYDDSTGSNADHLPIIKEIDKILDNKIKAEL